MPGTTLTPEGLKILLGGAEVSGSQVPGGLGKAGTHGKPLKRGC